MGLLERGGMYQWQARIDGRLYRKSTEVPIGGKAEKALALRRARDFELDVLEGRFGYKAPEVPTLAQWWVTYEAKYLPLKAAGTQRHDRMIMTGHALPYFGNTPLDRITQSMCVGYVNQRRNAFRASPRHKFPKPIAEGTVQRERGLLRTIFQRAVDDKILTDNPWKGIKGKADKVRERVITHEEQALLMAVMIPRYQRLVRFVIGTGVRLEELRGIDPAKHIDVERRRLRVFGKGKKWRTIPLSQTVLEIVQAQIDAEGQLWPQTSGVIRQALQGAAARAHIETFGPHALRHTFGWRWIKSGGDIYVLSKILGHASVRVTELHYAHVMQDDLRAAMDARELGI